jgi:hypothetical protein
MSPCIVMDDDGYWTICHNHPMWVRSIMISLPNRKNHCEGQITTQESRLFVL